ncbi:hypothetical protein TrLO_g7228 [Triparma laevis f. longispina]|uniref:Sm domain-containing protein n=1 Tax=Triparma laevis f. longispina TaxID=1714387 RepID=A0A9W7DS49_9STRA|nr:hypothetical protein TrLO_g7228 [Triparma laevis f. longispina]
MSKSQSILDLAPSLNKPVLVTFQTNLTASGTLLGYDELVNLVLKDATMQMGDGVEKQVGLIVCRGSQVVGVEGLEGRQRVEDPFKEVEGGGEGMAE